MQEMTIHENTSIELSEAGVLGWAFRVQGSQHSWVSFQSLRPRTAEFIHVRVTSNFTKSRKTLAALSTKSAMEGVGRELEGVEKPDSCRKYEGICWWPSEKGEDFFIGSAGSVWDMRWNIQLLCLKFSGAFWCPAVTGVPGYVQSFVKVRAVPVKYVQRLVLKTSQSEHQTL